METNSVSKKILFRAYFITLLIYNKKYKMVANFINKIGKENINEIKKILDSSVISENYNKSLIPMDMLINFVEDKDIYQTTKWINLSVKVSYSLVSAAIVATTIYLFPLKDVEGLSKFVNYSLPVLTTGVLIGFYTQLPYFLRRKKPHVFFKQWNRRNF